MISYRDAQLYLFLFIFSARRCNFNVGPFLDILVTIFAFQLALYAILSICGFAGWQSLDKALNEVKEEYRATEVWLTTMATTMTTTTKTKTTR